MAAMIARIRVQLGRLAILVGAGIVAMGCNTGGLLVAEKTSTDPIVPKVTGPSANELVSGGTYAKNGKYKLFYVVGQPTPNQGVATATGQRVNGGLVGAAHSN
jgi:hypothetical protein